MANEVDKEKLKYELDQYLFTKAELTLEKEDVTEKKKVVQTQTVVVVDPKKTIGYKLSKLKQEEFLEIYYGPFILVRGVTRGISELENYETEDGYAKEVKQILFLMNRRRKEIEKMRWRVGEPGCNPDEKAVLNEKIRRNQQVLELLRVVS